MIAPASMATKASVEQRLTSGQKSTIAIFDQVKRLADVDIKPIGGFEVKNETAMQKVEISSKANSDQKYQLTLAMEHDGTQKIVLEQRPHNSYIFFEKSNFLENTSAKISRAFDRLGDNFAEYKRQQIASVHSSSSSFAEPK